MTRGADTDTDTMARSPRRAPGRQVPPARGAAVPPGRIVPPRREEPPYARKPGLADAKAPGRKGRRPENRANPDARRRAAPPSPSPRMRAFSAPRHTRPIAGSPPEPATSRPPRPAARSAGGLRTRPRHPRAPFILLLVGLLGGALVSLLMISTTLAEGSFRITNLQQQNTNLARQEQLLTQQVAQAESPAEIAQEAEQYGMQQDPNLKFINLKTGKIVTGKVPSADAQINVPGYSP
jgi:hypothetical protein